MKTRMAILLLLAMGTGCASTGPTATAPIQLPVTQLASRSPDLPVDCRLPPAVRKMGRQLTYLSEGRVERIPAVECEIRGGTIL